MTETTFQMVFALAFVIFLIYAISFIYRKKHKSMNLINLVSYHSFGQKMGVAAVKVGNEILVLGVTPTDMKLLKKMPDLQSAKQEVTSIAGRVQKLRRMKEAL